MARVVLADDHPLFVDAVGAALEQHGIEVVAKTGRGDEVIAVVEREAPEVLLLDLNMPGRDGLSVLEELRRRRPDLKVIILSGDESQGTIDRALDLGAVCFVGKTAIADDLAHAIRLVSSPSPSVVYSGTGRAVAAPREARPPEKEERTADLTRRELEILKLAMEGHSNAQLARMLWVTEQTVKFHLSNIYRKLDVANRTQASAKARALGIGRDERVSA